MLFNSYEFILAFLPVTLVVFFVLGRTSATLAVGWLALASVFFYGWWNPKFVALLLASVVFNYCLGYVISRHATQRKGKGLLTFAVVANLMLLGVFKYANFFLSAMDEVLGTQSVLVNIILPLGISFFTFTQIAFLVDSYRGIAKEYKFVHYLLFVTYFPHLIAGPVLHHKQMMPQFSTPAIYRPSSNNFALGLSLFTIGLAKKVLLADSFAGHATSVFGMASAGVPVPFFAAWMGALAYTFQLYFDFSGYSDMAVGLSKLFGINLPINFNSPYKSPNIIDFWRRWHMTLSQFLRDYLYISIGGNCKGKTRRYVNLMLTMLLGGLWHGASWTFVIWGGYHGILLCLNYFFRFVWQKFFAFRATSFRFSRPLGMATTFFAVVVGWVLFRADTLAAAQNMLGGMFGKHAAMGSGLIDVVQVSPLLLAGFLLCWFAPSSTEIIMKLDNVLRRGQDTRWLRFIPAIPASVVGFIGGVGCAVTMMSLGQPSEFLYFQF